MIVELLIWTTIAAAGAVFFRFGPGIFIKFADKAGWIK